MAMLAETRRKQKWSVNPRGKHWSDDPNKLGQKMLEKMGWTSGKGLGVNEQGITEHVRVMFKDDVAGIGYDKSNLDKAWTEHQEKFNSFLQKLQEKDDSETVSKLENRGSASNRQSLELKSKQSNARVHYKKFTRGKDVNKYSSKDLANIFGQKDLKDANAIERGRCDDIVEKSIAGVKDNRGGVITINGGSMTDYFKLKLSNQNQNLTNYTIDTRATDSENETVQHLGLGFTSNAFGCDMLKNSKEKDSYAFDNPCLGLNSPTDVASLKDCTVSPLKKLAKKRRMGSASEMINLGTNEVNESHIKKKMKSQVSDIDCKFAFANPALNLDTIPDENYNSNKFEVSRAQYGLENSALDLTDEKSNKKRVTFNDHVEYNIDSVKKKKTQATLDKFEVENKKQKKRKRKNNSASISNGVVNEALDVEILYEETIDNKMNEHKSKRIKKKKLCKTFNLETIQESPEHEKQISKTEPDVITVDDSHIENEVYIVDSEKNKKIQKKKKTKKKEKEEEECVQVENIAVIGITPQKIDMETDKIIKNQKHEKGKERKANSIEKKQKKAKKSEKGNYKAKLVTYTVSSSDCEDVTILERSTLKHQENDYLMKNENNSEKQRILFKKSKKLELFSKGEMEKASLDNTDEAEQKKKSNKSFNNKQRYSENEIDTCDVEKEISDKENASNKEELDDQKLTKKARKCKKSKTDNIKNIQDFSNPNIEITNANINIKEEKIQNAEYIGTSQKKNKTIDITQSIIHSPWSTKTRMSKKMLKTLFHNNSVLNFPGSNIHDIKGYGANMECS